MRHEMDDAHRRLLAERKMDLAIDQNPDGQAFTALQRLLMPTGQATPQANRFRSEFALFTPTNIRNSAYFEQDSSD
ncbi:MAG: hypothetical protein CPDRYMAC_4777 [uncultured Paraburkholderia sp.]|nr:MAG: hypothetical protein CPDRYDRY_4691 [uncultured Paraburkholderia sp.]CAH2938088.1 MAG: hypothetical protein CPDRYMAC_4777 [uncultured Paraburkholderia sp.]